MADIAVTTTANSFLHQSNGVWGPYWSGDNGVLVFSDNGNDLTKSYTDDGGATWANTEIEAGTVRKISAFFDAEVPSDTGSTLHVTWINDGTDDCFYLDIDVTDGTHGTKRTVDSTITAGTGASNKLSITKTKNGNLLVAGATSTETFCYKSSDQFATPPTSINGPYEASTTDDWCLLFPANTADNADACGIYADKSGNELSVKMYDDSANSWTETSITTGFYFDATYASIDGAMRLSDSKILIAAHQNDDHTGDDFQTWEINPNSISSPGVTAKTNIYTNQGESAECAVMIDQNTDDVYIAYLKGGTWQSSVDVVYHKSTDGMATWGTEQAYSEDTAADFRVLSGGRSVNSDGGYIQWAFFDNDLNDIFVNTTNDVAISGSSSHSLTANALASTTSVDSPALTQVHDLTASALDSGTTVDGPTLTQVHSLTASEIGSGSTVDSPAQTQTHSLSGSEIASASSVDSPALSQAHNLTASEIASGTENETPAITQVHSLSASEIASTTSVDSPALGGTVALTADPLASTTSIESPALSVTHVLTASALSVATTVDSPAITQVHILTCPDLSCIVEIGPVTLAGAFYDYPTTISSSIKTRSAKSGIGSKAVRSTIKDLTV